MHTHFGIGLMSGSSLDGVDLAYVKFIENEGQYNFELLAFDCYAYEAEWLDFFKSFCNAAPNQIFEKDHALGKLFATYIQHFIRKHKIKHLDYIANHGHTLYHNPQNFTTIQIGNGAHIAALTGITTIDQLRIMDVALGGQGAPIVPIMDTMLLSAYPFCLNIGGIANITINDNKTLKAFDICAANQILNHFASKLQLPYDKDGAVAKTGTIDWDLIKAFHQSDTFLQSAPPKSLDNQYSKNIIQLLETKTAADALATATAHIAYEIGQILRRLKVKNGTMYATGGGTKNTFLIQHIKEQVAHYNIDVCIPEEQIIDYKEAIAMAFIGLLRLHQKENVLHQISGAHRSSINGCIWSGINPLTN